METRDFDVERKSKVNRKVNEFKEELIALLAEDDEICGIGQTGDMNAPLIPGKRREEKAA